jgi:hypothetical protein
LSLRSFDPVQADVTTVTAVADTPKFSVAV